MSTSLRTKRLATYFAAMDQLTFCALIKDLKQLSTPNPEASLRRCMTIAIGGHSEEITSGEADNTIMRVATVALLQSGLVPGAPGTLQLLIDFQAEQVKLD
jgi:hypothetical protein